MKPFQFKKIAGITVATFLVFAASIFYYFIYNEIEIKVLQELNRRELLQRELSSVLNNIQKYRLNQKFTDSKGIRSLQNFVKQARQSRETIKQNLAASYLKPESIFFRSVFKIFPVSQYQIAHLDSLLQKERISFKKSGEYLANLESLQLKMEDARKISQYHSIIEYTNSIKKNTGRFQSLLLKWVIVNEDIRKDLNAILNSLYNKNLFILLLLLLLNAAMYGIMIFVLLSIFTRPLVELGELSSKINSGEYSLKHIHIPHFKDDFYGKISMAFRSLLNHIEEVDRVKGSIMSQVTHDLKSPMATMKKSIDLLAGESYGKLTKEQKQVVEILKKGYDQMNHLVQNLLDAARMEYDVLSLKLEKFDLLQSTMEIFEEFRIPLIEKNIKIKYNFHQRQKLGMIGDEERIKDVLRNLLGNAIKFTPENGKIYVEIDLREGDVFIKIQDTGIGIPAKELDKIFEKMYRASNSKSISVKGTGMGLFIVKNIVKMHKGEIFVKSQLGVGTTFEIYLPRILRKPGEE
jgi:signal transduction histidine kinase